jgi:hypothetical protein
MKFSTISKAVAAVFFMGAVSGAAFAAENAAGVAEHLGLTVKTTEEAQAAAAAGNKELCLSSIKQAKQHYKEITGDASGMPMQNAIKLLKVAQEDCDKGDTGAAATKLTDVVGQMKKIQASVGK